MLHAEIGSAADEKFGLVYGVPFDGLFEQLWNANRMGLLSTDILSVGGSKGAGVYPPQEGTTGVI